MTELRRPLEIEWPDEIGPERRSELQDALVAYNQALHDLEAGPAAVFATEAERKRIVHGFLKHWDRRWSRPGACMHPGCANTAVRRSHSIALGGSIRQIAEDGHVLTPRHVGDRVELVPIGVRDASTFPGFCRKHEGLFAAFETRRAMTDVSDFRLQAYRTICRELYAKGHQLQKAEAMLEAHRLRREAFVSTRMQAAWRTGDPLAISGLVFGNDEFEQRLVEYVADAGSALRELEHLHGAILAELETGVEHVALLAASFDIQVPVCLSGFGVLHYREHGAARSAPCVLAIIPEAGGTKILLGAAAEHAQAIDLQLGSQSSFEIVEMLEQWMVDGSDHWFITPSAWQAIPQDRQDAICKRIVEANPLGEPLAFSVLDAARLHILGLARAMLSGSEIPTGERPAVEVMLLDQQHRLEWGDRRSPSAEGAAV